MAGLALGNALAARLGGRVERPLLLFAGLEAARRRCSRCSWSLALPAARRRGSRRRSRACATARWLRTRRARRRGLRADAAARLGDGRVAAAPRARTRRRAARASASRSAGSTAGTRSVASWARSRPRRCSCRALGLARERRRRRGAPARGRGPDRAPARSALPRRGWRRARSRDGRRRAAASTGAGGRACSSAAFLGGALLLALEVVWFRFLQLFVFGTQRAFALMLAMVLAGIGLGGLLARRAGCGDGRKPRCAAARGAARRGRDHHDLRRLRPGAHGVGRRSDADALALGRAHAADVARVRSAVHAARRGPAASRLPGDAAAAGWLDARQHARRERWARRSRGCCCCPGSASSARSSSLAAALRRAGARASALGGAGCRGPRRRRRPRVFALVVLLFPFG